MHAQRPAGPQEHLRRRHGKARVEMKAGTSKVSGIALALITLALRTPLLAALVRRVMARTVVDARLAHIDIAADVAPLYTPPDWRAPPTARVNATGGPP